MTRTIALGIDIGTHQVKVVAAESAQGSERPKVIGVGFAESRGLRHGYILNQADTIKSIRQAVKQAEKASGVPLKRATVGIGGIGLGATVSTGTVAISRADSEITELDVKKAIEQSRRDIPPLALQNRRVLHTIEQGFKVDGKNVPGRPEGLMGSKLEVKTLFITCFSRHVDDLLETLQATGIEPEDVVAAPLPAGLVTLTKQQKMAGCVLANIGSETTSIVVFENNLPSSLEVFQIGSSDITNDIALGLRIPLEEAEEIKRGTLVGGTHPRKKVQEIIEARLGDIFELIEAHLKKIGRSGLLPAGVVLTGGGSSVEGLVDIAKSALKLPARIASISFGDNIRGQIRDASWSVAYGLCVIALGNGEEETISGLKLAKRTKNNLLNVLRQFLP